MAEDFPEFEDISIDKLLGSFQSPIDADEFMEDEIVTGAKDIPDWRLYEEQIVDKFQREFPNEDISPDIKVPGYFSKTDRQVDILIKSTMVGRGIFGVVECKHFNKNVDVKVVDSFIGFLQDVRANLGIIITNQGFSEAARNRAEVSKIDLVIVEFSHLEEYHYDIHFCDICFDEDRFPGVVDFNKEPQDIRSMDLDDLIDIGRCDRCNEAHVLCLVCGEITPVSEMEYGDPMECQGGCGLVFRFDEERDTDDISSDLATVVITPPCVEDERMRRKCASPDHLRKVATTI